LRDDLSEEIKEAGVEIDGGDGMRLVNSAGNVYAIS
jgi:hypothetical protein